MIDNSDLIKENEQKQKIKLYSYYSSNFINRSGIIAPCTLEEYGIRLDYTQSGARKMKSALAVPSCHGRR